MEEILLEAQLRDSIGKSKVNSLRKKGLLPAVVYGEGKEGVSIMVSNGEFIRLLHQHKGENLIMSIKIKDDKKAKPRICLLKDVQHDPVHDTIVHVDFHEISLTKAIKVNVAVETVGEAVGVKQDGGVLDHILWEVEVECLPTAIPKSIPVDISALKIGDSVHVKDIVFPAGVKPLNDPDASVVAVIAPMKEEVPAETLEAGPQEPEVIKEKKEVPAEDAESAGKDKEKK